MKNLNLKDHYNNKVKQELQKELGCNSMSVPKLVKIGLNCGGGAYALANKSNIMEMKKSLQSISGRMPIITNTKKSIAGFKIREGWPIGVKVTLRDDVMWEFLQKLVFVSMPRIRDFRGVSKKSFDGRGNFSFGIKEHTIFPEVDYSSQADKMHGLDITIVTSAVDDDGGYALLSALCFPFKEKIAQLKEGEK